MNSQPDIPWLHRILLTYTPEPRGLQAEGVRVYISAKSQRGHGINDMGTLT